jgi:crossover junction endodeoxyribonuclease RuvC
MAHTICGIDPGLGITGYAVLRTDARGGPGEVVEAGACRFGGKDKVPLAERLVQIDTDMTAIFAEHAPDIVAVEQLYAHYKHPRTAILMGHARGVILLAAARAGIEVRHFAATRVKRHLTGNGRASKLQVQRAVQTHLGLAAPPEPPDVADAIAIALCCAAEVAAKHTGLRGPR